MFKTGKARIFIISSLVIVIALMSFSPGILAESVSPPSEVQEKLEGISDEEKGILQKLFALTHEIEEMSEEEEKLAQEAEALNREVTGLEEAITGEENVYNGKKDVLKQVLQVYQRKGPGSYLEIILDSENLNMLLWRVSTLQDLSRNTGNLLETLEKTREELNQKKAEVAEKLTLMESKKAGLKEALNKKMQLKEDMNKYLASLNDQRKHYQEQLDNLQQVWSKLKLLFSDISGEFSRMIKEGKLPLDSVKMAFSLNGIEGLIDEKAFNDISSGNPRLSEMNFKFHKDIVEISVPKMGLILTGRFDILDGNTLKFSAEGGSFYGVSLDNNTIEELFKEGYVEFNLKPLVESSIVSSVEVMEGYLKFVIIPHI